MQKSTQRSPFLKKDAKIASLETELEEKTAEAVRDKSDKVLYAEKAAQGHKAELEVYRLSGIVKSLKDKE